MKTLFALMIGLGLVVAPAAFAKDAMNKPGMGNNKPPQTIKEGEKKDKKAKKAEKKEEKKTEEAPK